jgi:fructose-bisphosphate aldolase class II
MRILTKREEVLARLAEAARARSPVFCPNGETVDEIEGILAAADIFRRKRGLETLAVGIAITGTYPDHPQLRRLDFDSDLGPDGAAFIRSGGSIESRAFIWLDWLGVYGNRPALFPGIEVIPVMDHGWVPSAPDLALLANPEFQDRMGIVMFDASACPLEENAARTAEYARVAGKRVVVEACPDKIPSAKEVLEAGPGYTVLTDPAGAADFVKATGVDLIDPSLGTEHRGIPGETIHYRRHLAQDLARRVGPILALHGTTSLGDKITEVGRDGIVKVNFYTGMARSASQAVRTSWAARGPEPLKLEFASGSFIHNVRRKSVREECLRMLELLHGKGSCLDS